MLSFANLGVGSTSGGNVNYHVSPTKAYFVSQETLEVVVRNPEATLVDLTSAELTQPGLVVPGFVYNIVKVR